ncbi:MAG: DUF6966 domain-containing protein [Desulfitobacteriaceae bacterium]
MDIYLQSLSALESLLDNCGEHHWKTWITRDIYLWESNRSVEHHLSAYGGMGSINDLVLCQQNKHQLTKEQVPWANDLLIELLSLCSSLARLPQKTIRFESTDKLQIQGWRCLSCGYSELTMLDIENYISRPMVRKGMEQAIKSCQLVEFIPQVLSICLPGIEDERAKIKNIALQSGINVTTRDGCLRPCPHCGDNDTAVYRWDKQGESWFAKFIPAPNNLSIKQR